MTTHRALISASMAAVIVLAGCSTPTRTAAPADTATSSPTATKKPRATATPTPAREDCAALPEADLAALMDGAKEPATKLGAGAVLPLPEDLKAGTYTRVAMVTVDDPKGKVALFALGAEPGGGPYLALDQTTLDLFTWGEAAKRGSAVGIWRDKVARSSTAADLKHCPR